MQQSPIVRALTFLLLSWSISACTTAAHPCFEQGTMYPDRSSSCQYGRAYRCDNGDWMALRRSCAPAGPEVAVAPAGCEAGGIAWASGSARCDAGYQYRCDGGRWLRLDLPCTMGDAPYSVSRTSSRTCAYGGATVASSSAICQGGTTFLCDDGQWINLGTSCR